MKLAALGLALACGFAVADENQYVTFTPDEINYSDCSFTGEKDDPFLVDVSETPIAMFMQPHICEFPSQIDHTHVYLTWSDRNASFNTTDLGEIAGELGFVDTGLKIIWDTHEDQRLFTKNGVSDIRAVAPHFEYDSGKSGGSILYFQSWDILVQESPQEVIDLILSE